MFLFLTKNKSKSYSLAGKGIKAPFNNTVLENLYYDNDESIVLGYKLNLK